MKIQIAGETLELLPQRAMLWPAQNLLLIADIHFGKAAAFRAKGLPVPRGTTTQNLELLTQLVSAHQITHIVFLGDFLHAKAAQAQQTLSAMRAWRQIQSHLDLTLIRGNHDTHAGDPPADLGIRVVDEPYQIGPFAFCHHPDLPSAAYVLAGHVHPVYRLHGRGDSARLPCFLFSERRGILPSFGAFTGGHVVAAKADEKVFVVTDDSIFQIPSR